MDSEFLKRLLSPERSAEERDIMCAAAFGKTFAESTDELRVADFLDGLEGRRYMPTRVGAQALADEEEKTVEIEFVLLRECWNMSDPVFALYECDGSLPGSAWTTVNVPPRFTAVFAGDDALTAQFAAMKCMRSYYEVF